MLNSIAAVRGIRNWYLPGTDFRDKRTGSRVAFQCVNSDYLLRNQDLYDIGDRKYAHAFAQDEESYQGEYTPERTLLPILPSEYKTVGGATDLTIRETQNPSEGVPCWGYGIRG